MPTHIDEVTASMTATVMLVLDPALRYYIGTFIIPPSLTLELPYVLHL